ncbi:MAG TPA: endo-1,4-beta-xylanase [Kiritimatiellia bacterium]|nr:endo-1,4-beta-xylanase [Kiritimatiellia bacterium]HPS07605.1 endo-1,4-beta-xylanase [Kiritimatiellia bacterium]
MKTVLIGLVGVAGVMAYGAEQNPVMSEAYWKLWNPEVQARIDRDIEQNRKADGVFKPEGLKAGTDVNVEQLSHDFIFGAHIFNFDQLGKDEYNARYKELFGTLFNSATIAFYWKKFELEEGKPRFKAEQRDTAAYWNACQDPKNEPHWRRPASDPVVAFCESKGIRLHGHTLTWGNRKWQWPEWVTAKAPECIRAMEPVNKDGCDAKLRDALYKKTPAEIEALAPEYARTINRLMADRIAEIARYYKGRFHSWDVVNESATDFGLGRMIPGDGICKSHYGVMPGDYTYQSFKIADSVFPKEAKLNINDYQNGQAYVDQVKDLLSRGCKIDIMGSQMHLFNPQTCLDIAAGKPGAPETPEKVWSKMALLAQAGLPIHLSEITITAPNNDERGQAIQAVITRNLYRLWFSVKPMMGITWWNVVDDCGAPGEPSVSGLFSRDMKPKPAYFAMNDLINKEWKTTATVKAGDDGSVKFRGFKGKYRLTWTDAAGQVRHADVHLDGSK